ncbi:MAG: hypothetical protein GWN76_19910, partial [candidate division Zixibacteria bacterium]|nr:hypothetical protein [candidate division Zixibacteria bacterium]NIX58544.1 hypothetical protein [candidate division Zixibacteria bacterium]
MFFCAPLFPFKWSSFEHPLCYNPYMEFVDIAFPLKLGRLTYRIPEGMVVEPGNIVRAEVKKSIKRGIVLGPSRSRPRGKIKDIAQVEPYGLGMAMARLIEWMADYYF